MKKKYDVIVIGGGHAGIEASFVSAKLGCSVLLVSIDIDGIGQLSCNPAVGGVSKGHLVREVDALGGLIGKITDRSAINYRILNKSKGQAVWATRAQVDRFLYPKIARSLIEKEKNLQILKSKISKILIKNKHAAGVETNFGEVFYSKTVIICTGTFLKSTIHIGLESFPGGRLYEDTSNELFDNINSLGMTVKHFKTGTCARLDKRTIDFTKMTEQPPDYDTIPFSLCNTNVPKNQDSCYITYTNSKTHKVIKKNLCRSPLYSGKIKARGVRYCPSLEDKVVKFSERDRHPVFIEPEGRDSVEVYPNGVSTSLPFDVQCDFLRTIDGLENAVIMRPGYGIEHGVIDARELYPTLESRKLRGIFFAGQVNGTTGYEEASAQGIIAGINSALFVKKQKPFILKREDAFIGVMIDDLTSKGTDEPYRMFTSRSEFRLSLRESNASFRLTPLAYKFGLVTKEEYDYVLNKQSIITSQIKKIRNTKIFFDKDKQSIFNILKRPQIIYSDIEEHLEDKITDEGIRREIEIEVKYEGFLRRELMWIKELRNIDRIKIPKIDYASVPSLSKEVIEKLVKFKPLSLGEAIRISGITPAAIMNIYNFIKRKKDSYTHEGHKL